jgi:hypothetical protein
MLEQLRRRVSRQAPAALGVGLVLVVAALTRLARYDDVLAGGELLALDGDSHYHVWRIETLLQGAYPGFDPLMNWPRGASAPWSDGFDVLGAAFAFLAGRFQVGPEAHLAVFLWPVVLGLLAVWASVDVARRLVPSRDAVTPIAAAFLAAFTPTFVKISSMGRVDHHIAEALTLLLLVSWAMRRFPVEEERRPGGGWELAGAGAVALALWLFVGGLLYVALAVVPLGLVALGRDQDRQMVGSGAPALMAGALLAAVATVPAMRAHGMLLSFMFPSLLQPALVGMAGLALGAALLAGRSVEARSGAVRATAQLAAALGVLGVPLLLVPPLRQELVHAVAGWLLRQDPWIRNIAEFQPLITRLEGGGFELRHVRVLLGPVGMLAPLAIPVGAVVAWRHSAARAATFAGVAMALSAMAILQLRFARIAAPFLAIAIALSLRGLARLLARSPALDRPSRWVPLLGATLLVAVSPRLRGELEVVGPIDPVAVHHAALDLRLDRTPVPGRRDGVLAPWDLGHAFRQLSGRPVTANGFGSYLDPVSFQEIGDAFLGSEARLVKTMERYDLGFVVGGGLALEHHQSFPVDEGPVIGDPPGLNPAFMRRTSMSQLLIAGSGMPEERLPHLERLMPIFASRATARGLSFPLPVVWTYELVAGAVLTGDAAPGTLVAGELGLVEWGRAHRYRAFTRAGADGRFQLRVPLPSGFSTPTLHTGPAWRITVGDGRAVDVDVPEAAVRGGSTVAVP